eukprot:Rmarinus@m.23090
MTPCGVLWRVSSSPPPRFTLQAKHPHLTLRKTLPRMPHPFSLSKLPPPPPPPPLRICPPLPLSTTPPPPPSPRLPHRLHLAPAVQLLLPRVGEVKLLLLLLLVVVVLIVVVVTEPAGRLRRGVLVCAPIVFSGQCVRRPQ